MLSHVTEYLLQFRRVTLPGFGTIEIQQRPARLEFVDRLIYPPGYATEFSRDEDVSQHQITYLAAVTNADEENVRAELSQLGMQLNQKISNGSYRWNGIGEISSAGIASDILSPLTPTPAEKVSRSDAEHTVLVGDREVTGTEHAATAVRKRRLSSRTIALVLLALGVIAIVAILFLGKFEISSFGLRLAP